ncbi:hypothetical protein AKJ65_07385, partial [candidate division MSBL1 archaeon SCGC-AAA259E19]
QIYVFMFYGNFDFCFGFLFCFHYITSLCSVGRLLKSSTDSGTLPKSYETSYGECYVYEGGDVNIGEHSWRVVSYHDSTREKVREKMESYE